MSCTRAARVTDLRHILSLTISGRSSCDQRGADEAFFVWRDSETPDYYYRTDTIISLIVSFGRVSMVVVVVEGIPAFWIRRWMLGVGTRPDTTYVTYLILGFVARWSGVIPISSKRHQQQHFGSVPGTYPKTEGISTGYLLGEQICAEAGCNLCNQRYGTGPMALCSSSVPYPAVARSVTVGCSRTLHPIHPSIHHDRGGWCGCFALPDPLTT